MRRHQGFSLIELMIVLVIIGILAAIAIPSYTDYVRKAHRADAQAILMEWAYQMERQYTQDNFYDTDGAKQEKSDSYKFAAQKNPNKKKGAGFLLKATPINSQSEDRCGVLKLYDTGERDAQDDDCW
ncbi:type IV pilin protein [Chromohalobacter nigrandesensis]|uniref:type IV pilin protein n=1 Tax=Chromohalobacter nigrandesensis TaxID=119863 RepID=UPI001FF31BBA|nr:type IV pilin protein [Chromohalobacter nigrandesensis]MCK0746789.1 prepilin-type N-terminal cleavage/methylation domain-containing protein [Chromohalobacter nigrandesensis]